MLFTDNMMIPAKAAHPYAAETMMNFVYEPEVAAKITKAINYISPGGRGAGGPAEDGPGARQQPARLPRRRRSASGSTPTRR